LNDNICSKKENDNNIKNSSKQENNYYIFDINKVRRRFIIIE